MQVTCGLGRRRRDGLARRDSRGEERRLCCDSCCLRRRLWGSPKTNSALRLNPCGIPTEPKVTELPAVALAVRAEPASCTPTFTAPVPRPRAKAERSGQGESRGAALRWNSTADSSTSGAPSAPIETVWRTRTGAHVFPAALTRRPPSAFTENYLLQKTKTRSFKFDADKDSKHLFIDAVNDL